MICYYFDWKDEVFELRASFLECANDDHEFFIIDLVVALCWIVLLWEVDYWVKNIILIVLRKNVFEYIVRDIDFYHYFVIWVVVTKNDIKSENFFQDFECFLTFLRSNKDYILFDKTN